jgi:hypothetical protein
MSIGSAHKLQQLQSRFLFAAPPNAVAESVREKSEKAHP